MKNLKELLIEFDACSPAKTLIDWAGDKNIEEFVKECHRGDWLLEMANRLKLPKRKLIACAGHCANTVRHLIEDESSINLLDMCMNFEDESISFEELNKANLGVGTSDDYTAARTASLAVKAAANKVVFKKFCFPTFTSAYFSAKAAAETVDCDIFYRHETSAGLVANRSNDNSIKFHKIFKYKQLQTANIVRERLGQDIINKVNKLLNN